MLTCAGSTPNVLKALLAVCKSVGRTTLTGLCVQCPILNFDKTYNHKLCCPRCVCVVSGLSMLKLPGLLHTSARHLHTCAKLLQ